MNQNPRVPPSYVPTLTEVVHQQSPISREAASAAPEARTTSFDLDALTDSVFQRVMPQLTQRLEESLRERLFQWADEQATALLDETARVLVAGLEPAVREALAQCLREQVSNEL